MNRRQFIERVSCCALGALCTALESGQALTASQPYPIPVPPPRAKARRIIVVDPGHGGADPGTVGHSGIEEKFVVLAIAREFARELAHRTGATVRLTRERDVLLPLEDRIGVAQSLRADLFISVHADSCPEADARGLSIYTLSEVASDRLAAALAEHENRVDMLYDVNLRHVDKSAAPVLFDLARRETLNLSRGLQSRLIADLAGKTRLLEHPTRSANFAVLRSPSVPAMLIETGFLSNLQDDALLSSPHYRQDLAGLLARSVADVFPSWVES